MKAPTTAAVVAVLLVVVSGTAEGGKEEVSEPQGPGARCVHIDNFTTAERGPCKDYLTYQLIYTDDNAAFRFAAVQLWTRLQGFVAEPCLGSSWQKLCAGMFRECMRIPDPSAPSNVAIVGRYQCRSVCVQNQGFCQEAVKEIIKLTGNITTVDELLDCKVPSELTWGAPSFDIFPDGNYTVGVSADEGLSFFNTTIPCYEDNLNLTAVPSVECPDGLHPTGEPGACAFDCPQPVITNNEYQAVEVMMSVMAWISLAATAFVAGSYLLVASKRKFPANLPLFFVVAVGGRTLAFCVGSMVGHEEVWCDGDKHFNSFGDAACTIQGILFVYFTWAGALWWLTITLNLFFTLVLSWQHDHLRLYSLPFLRRSSLQQQQTRKKGVSLVEVVFHACCWGIPLIPLIIALSGQQLGYAGASFWCTIHSGQGEVVFEGSAEGTTHSGSDEDNLWNLMLLTVPILVFVFVGVVLLLTTAVFGYKKSQEGWQFLIRQWRLFAFLLLYVWIYTFVFSFQIHFNYVQEAQYEAYDDYINCLYIQAVQKITNPSQPLTCELSQEVNFGLWFVVTFNEVSQGLFVFLIFGTSAGVFQAWRSALLECRWSAGEDIDPSRGSSSGKHSSSGVVVVVEGVNMKEFSEETSKEEESSDTEEEEDEDASEELY